MPRDSQYSKLSRAVGALPEWEKDTSVVDYYNFPFEVCGRKFIKKKFQWEVGNRFPRTMYNRGRLYIGSITFRRWSKLKVLYAIARHFTSSPSTPAHGPIFCRTLLILVQNVMGKEVAERLKAAYKANKVHYRKPRRDVTNREGNPTALRMYRLKKELEGRQTPVWELLGGK